MIGIMMPIVIALCEGIERAASSVLAALTNPAIGPKGIVLSV